MGKAEVAEREGRASQASGAGSTADFADVYQAHLAPVWRYVRSRVAGYHDSQDVTAEVFTRAWRSWPGYNPRRGAVAPWLFRIAQRTVADFHRRRPAEVPAAPESQALDRPTPSVLDALEEALLDRELLNRLGWALAHLSDRDRNCVALRFAGELKLAEVAEVLGISTDAAKMAMMRALRRLAQAMAELEQGRAGQAPAPVALEDAIRELVVSGDPAVSNERLQELIVHVSALHQPSTPPELPARLAACIACADRFSATESAGPADGELPPGWRGRLARRLGLAPMTGLSWTALAPVCLACTIPVLLVPFVAAGLSLEMVFGLHLAALATAPILFWLLWRHHRRHGDRLPVALGGVGALALAVHFPLHFIPGEGGVVLFMASDQAGTALLVAGAVLDWRSMTGWMSHQRRRLESLAPALALG